MSEPDIAHPREATRLIGAEATERAFLSAIERGRLHHAWLLVGPEGIGKATFAYRAARRLLGAAPAPDLGLLGADPGDPVFRQIAGRAHPDLLTLEVETEGRIRKWISVDNARALPEFFAKSPGNAAYRVAIVDAADELNANAANAVLKTLEEPPERGVLFLVSHRPGSLLPTLRSRCRRLVFSPPPSDVAARWLQEAGEISREAAAFYLEMAHGAPGLALRRAAGDSREIDERARKIVGSLPRIDPSAAQALADSFRGPAGAQPFSLAIERLAAALKEEIIAGLDAPADRLDRWAEAWSMLSDLPGEVEGLNLDRGDAFYTALERLRSLR